MDEMDEMDGMDTNGHEWMRRQEDEKQGYDYLTDGWLA
jgi:hypothetical protein